MTRRWAIGLLAGLASAGVLVACDLVRSSEELRYRLKIEVATPEGLRTGASVWSFSLHEPTLALASPYSAKFRGEAVAVDLPGGRTLFALVRDVAMLPERHFSDLGPTPLAHDRVANVRAISRHVGARRQLICATPPSGADGKELSEVIYDCPMLVTFRDLKDPMSVEAVDPANLAASFGPGTVLKRITVEITNAPVTTGIEKRLGWLARSEDGGLDRTKGVSANPTLAQRISFLDFRRR